MKQTDGAAAMPPVRCGYKFLLKFSGAGGNCRRRLPSVRIFNLSVCNGRIDGCFVSLMT